MITTNVQSVFAVRGAEFINSIATVMTARITKKAEDSLALDDLTYGDMMEDLSSVWRDVRSDINEPKLNDGYWKWNTLPPIFYLMVKLGLAVDPKIKRGPGRPEKQKTEGEKPKAREAVHLRRKPERCGF